MLTVGGLPQEQVCAALATGDLEVRGRLHGASNTTLLGRVTHDGTALACVYKPVRGERPLWDFPGSTLARREVAAYELSRACGLDVVPPTVFRDGPAGEGSVQVWVGNGAVDDDGDPLPDRDPGADLIDLFRPHRVPSGWLPVLSGEDGAGRPVVLAHADDPALRAMAVFDAVANNADRKAGHVLRDEAGAVLGIDHGLTFHPAHKLRTVLWGFGDQQLGADLLVRVDRLVAGLAGSGVLRVRLSELLDPDEVDATARRARRLLETGEFPTPREGHPTVPWPLF